MRGVAQEARAALAERLRQRRPEIAQAALTRVAGISDPTESSDPEYVEGLRAAVGAALDYGIEAVEHGEERAPPLPTVLLAQARLAARNGVSLDTVLRRYFAGYTLLGDFLVEESAKDGPSDGASLGRLLRVQATLFDRMIAAVSEEYCREAATKPGSLEQRRSERVKRLLAGEMLDASDLGYDFGGGHLGAIAVGSAAATAFRDLARALDRRLLLVPHGGDSVWAWLGGRRSPDLAELQAHVSASWPTGLTLAIGEPGEGLAGWRLTHHQARAALPIALRSPRAFARYADVALLAALLQDDVLSTSLRELYLDPLGGDSDDGAALRETLRAYFAADRNVSSAAVVLGVKRHTVTNRLRVVEERIGCAVTSCATELDAALRLEELEDAGQQGGGLAHV